MKKFIATLVLVCFTSMGCTGSFTLTKKVYNWHRSQSDKWSDEFGFLVCALLPIYGISTFADALVFNSIEFWTGKNPVQESRAQTDTKYVKTKDAEAKISFNPQAQQLTIAAKTAQGESSTVRLERVDNAVLTKDAQGHILYTTMLNDKGEYLVFNQNQDLIKRYSPQEVKKMQEKYIK